MKIQTVTAHNIVLGDGIPKICIPITAQNPEKLKTQISNILESPCDMVEWRADFYENSDQRDICTQALEILREQMPDMPLLFTFRTKEEGGERSISMDAYESLNVHAAASGKADFVDLEYNRGEALVRRITQQIHQYGVLVIGSFHDFEKTPGKKELTEILCAMQSFGADITKAAVMPQTDRDVLELLDASLLMKEQYADRPFITMSMGRTGAVSRLTGSLTGSAVTFATAGKASAPGQMDAELVSRILPVLQS